MQPARASNLTQPPGSLPLYCPQVPNVKFNVAKMLEKMAPLVDRSVVEQQIKPTLRSVVWGSILQAGGRAWDVCPGLGLTMSVCVRCVGFPWCTP